jgi:hypothetical protein
VVPHRRLDRVQQLVSMVDAPRHVLEGTDRGDSQRSGTARGVPDSRQGRCRTAHSSGAAHLPALATCSCAISANRHSALISRICSIVRACDPSRRGLATMQVLELEKRGDEEGGQRLRLGERVPFSGGLSLGVRA